MRILSALTIVTLAIATPATAADMVLESSDIQEGQTLSMKQVYRGFGCEGDNISPALSWKNVPEGTKSLGINVHDPDAPTGSGWWHWIVFNMPATTTHLEAGASASSMPMGAVEGRNDYGSVGFGGACPPKGDKPHRYIFTLYALDVPSIDMNPYTPAAQVGYKLNKHAIAKATLTATYGR